MGDSFITCIDITLGMISILQRLNSDNHHLCFDVPIGPDLVLI